MEVRADKSGESGGNENADVHTPDICDLPSPHTPVDDATPGAATVMEVCADKSGENGGNENADVHAPDVCDPPSPHTPVDDADLDKVSGPEIELCVIGGKIVPVVRKGSKSAVAAVPLRMELPKRKATGKDKMVDEQPRPKIVKGASDRDKAKESVNAPRVTRGQSKSKPSSSLTSPYMVREVPVTMKLIKNEKVLFAWLLSSDNTEGFDFVFEHGDVKLTFDDARTMESGCLVACGVLNAWSRFLNLRERLKATESYSRFYFSTYPELSTVVNPEKSWTGMDAFVHFADRVDNELAQLEEHVDIEFIDLVFFSIWQDNHYYVIVFNFRAKNVTIIDNSDAVDDEPMSTKYNRIPQRLYKFFMAYFKSCLMLSKTMACVQSPFTA